MSLYAVPENSQTPYPADYNRMVESLKDMGYQVDEIVKDRAAGGVFDSIPFLFTFDATGRFMSIRALWETPLKGCNDSLHLFTVVDEWNREKYFPTLYWITAEDGAIQICADLVVDTVAGLSDDQMTENLGAGISTGIAAIRYAKEGISECLGMPVNIAESPSGGAAFGLS